MCWTGFEVIQSIRHHDPTSFPTQDGPFMLENSEGSAA